MAIFYKFRSEKEYKSLLIESSVISLSSLKRLIVQSNYKTKKKGLCLGTDVGFIVTNAQTNEEYVDDVSLIPRNTSVIIRRIPGDRRGRPINAAPVVIDPPPPDTTKDKTDSVSTITNTIDDEFGDDVYAVPKKKDREEEDSKIKALVNTPALDGIGRNFWGLGSYGFSGFEKKTPPEGYVCHRCQIPGHFIQHCPTNGDPSYNFKRLRPPPGIPKSMLVENPDGSYKMPDRTFAVLRPSEAAFDKRTEGISSSSSSSRSSSIPPELHCPLCKQVMKEAVLTRKCCFQSFCSQCIRDHIIQSNSNCACGATNILTDDLIPNMTVRNTIKRIFESGSISSSGSNSTTTFEPRHKESKVASLPAKSAASSKEETKPLPGMEETSKKEDAGSQVKKEVPSKQSSSESGKKKRKREASHQVQAATSYMMPTVSCAYNSYWGNGIQLGMNAHMAPYAMPYISYY